MAAPRYDDPFRVGQMLRQLFGPGHGSGHIRIAMHDQRWLLDRAKLMSFLSPAAIKMNVESLFVIYTKQATGVGQNCT